MRSGDVVCDHSSHLDESPLGDWVCQLGEDELQHLQGNVGEIQEDPSVIFIVDSVFLTPDNAMSSEGPITD